MTRETIQGITVKHFDGWDFRSADDEKKLLARLPYLAYDELLFNRAMEQDKEYAAKLTLDVSDQEMKMPMKPAYLGDMFKHNFVEMTDRKNVLRGWIVRDKAWYNEKTSLTWYLEHPGYREPFGYGMFWHPMPSEMLADSVPLNTPMKCLLEIELI